MRAVLTTLILALLPTAASADRISEMTRTERCTYSARMQVVAAHYFRKGTPRAEVKILWHGDETPAEVAFVNRLMDEGYAAMQREVDAGRGDIPFELLGDRAYETCMKEQAL